MNSGPLLRAIRAYKDEDARGWAWLFGRVLAGYLDANSTLFEGFDLIALNPSYTGDGAARTWDHVRLIAERADVESLGRWPFDLSRRAVIEKTSMTPRMREAATAQERRRIGFEELAPALLVTAPTRVHGKRILVFDDVFTAGDTLQQVAFKLRGAGAASVSALVLARQPWTRP
jgi:predicted amidophosphoribosyltransferase